MSRLRSTTRIAGLLIASCILCAASCAQPVAETFCIEVDGTKPMSLPAGVTEAEIQASLITTLQQRLGDHGSVQHLPGGKIKVELLGDLDSKQLAALKRTVIATGEFEFRILASPVAASDQAIVVQALQLAPKEKELRINDKIVAKWLPGLQDASGPLNLLVHRQAGDMQETLALIDPLDVTGIYFTSAEKTPSQIPKHFALRLTLNSKGGQLLGQLTTDNLPTVTGERHAIALIRDGSIVAAPALHAKISDAAILEGLSEEEIDSLISILNAGTLPLPVREVTKP